MHLWTSSISLAGSGAPPERLSPHILRRRTIPAVNAGICLSIESWVSHESDCYVNQMHACLEVRGRVLWCATALKIHHVCT